MKNIIFVTLMFLFQGCIVQSVDSISSWQSQHHNFKVSYPNFWTGMPSSDTKDKMLFGLIDKSDGKSYIIKISKDISKEELSDEAYIELFKESMLAANSKNKLINEKKVEFHGLQYYFFEFVMFTDKWGVLKQYAYFRRPGDFLTGVQISFPITNEDANEPMPAELIELDKHITF